MSSGDHPVNWRECDERHKHVDSDIASMRCDVEKINNKLWSGLVLIILQLVGVLSIFLKGCI